MGGIFIQQAKFAVRFWRWFSSIPGN